MPAPLQNQVRNRLLNLMADEDFATISPYLERVNLPKRFAFCEPHKPSEYCYFVESGIGSVVAPSPEGQSAEIGIIGFEGMMPIAIALRSESDPYQTFMQVEGHGYRLLSEHLSAAIAGSTKLQIMFSRYAQAHSVQAAYTALSNAVHHIDERLARWILMCHDRTEGDSISLTHEFLGVMLAVRRSSVTTALHVMEGNHFIYSERGEIIIRDRAALEAFASDAYGTPEREYERLIGPMKPAVIYTHPQMRIPRG